MPIDIEREEELATSRGARSPVKCARCWHSEVRQEGGA